MGWARMDDQWHDHPKTVAAGLEAAGLWAMCLTWAHKERRRKPDSTGVVPEGVIVRFVGSETKAKKLIGRLHTVKYFDDHTEAGWPIHDFADYLPNYDSEKQAEAGRKGGSSPRKPKQPGSEVLSETGAKCFESAERNEATRATARRNPIPVPKPIPEEQQLPPSAGAANGAALAVIVSAELVPANGVDVGAIVAEWVDSCIKRPPNSVISRIGKQIRVMAEEGITRADLRAGLAAWQAKGADPSSLASFVNQAMNAGPTKTRNQQATDDLWSRANERAVAIDAAREAYR